MLLFTGLCCFFVSNLFSQGCLQFNQVLNIKSGDRTLTVPAKVNTVVGEETFPLWLNAGTTLAAGTGVFMISIVAFNIIP